MAKKKAGIEKKVEQKKSTLIKIAEKVGELAGEFVNKKEELTGKASDAIKSVKTSINNFTNKKNAPLKKSVKAVAKKAVKKATPKVKKATKAVTEKASTVKKTAKKVVTKKAKGNALKKG